MNRVILLGRIENPVELKRLPQGTFKLSPWIEVENETPGKPPCRVRINIWGRQAENAAVLKKNDRVLVEGRLESIEHKIGDDVRVHHEVNVASIKFL